MYLDPAIGMFAQVDFEVFPWNWSLVPSLTQNGVSSKTGLVGLSIGECGLVRLVGGSVSQSLSLACEKI